MKNFLKSVLRIAIALVIIVGIALLAAKLTLPLEPEAHFQLKDGESLVVNEKGESLEGKLTIEQSWFSTMTKGKKKYTLKLETDNIPLIVSTDIQSNSDITINLKNIDKINKKKFDSLLTIIFDNKEIYSKNIQVEVNTTIPKIKFVRDFKRSQNNLVMYKGDIYRNNKAISGSIQFDENIVGELTCIDSTLQCKSRISTTSPVLVIDITPKDDILDVKTHYKIYDLAGNATEGDITFKYDAIAPKLTQISQTLIPWNSGFSKYVFKVKANEALQFMSINKYPVKLVNGYYSLPITGLKIGVTKTVEVNAHDYAGNQTLKSYYIRVTTPPQSTTAPISCVEMLKLLCGDNPTIETCDNIWFKTCGPK